MHRSDGCGAPSALQKCSIIHKVLSALFGAHLFRDNATETVIRAYPIPQNEDGMDMEDRILLLKKLISTKELLSV